MDRPLEKRIANLEKETAKLKEVIQPKKFTLCGELIFRDFLQKARESGLAIR